MQVFVTMLVCHIWHPVEYIHESSGLDLAQTINNLDDSRSLTLSKLQLIVFERI